jgi:galactose-1-phosphate uridylyltransferase
MRIETQPDPYVKSAHRTKRPWQGAQEPPQSIDLPAYDEKCYLCPGNARSSGDQRNEDYTSTFVSSCCSLLLEDQGEMILGLQAGFRFLRTILLL